MYLRPGGISCGDTISRFLLSVCRLFPALELSRSLCQRIFSHFCSFHLTASYITLSVSPPSSASGFPRLLTTTSWSSAGVQLLGSVGLGLARERKHVLMAAHCFANALTFSSPVYPRICACVFLAARLGLLCALFASCIFSSSSPSFDDRTVLARCWLLGAPLATHILTVRISSFTVAVPVWL